MRRAAAAAAQLEDVPEDEDQREVEAFARLRIMRDLLQAAKRRVSAVLPAHVASEH